MEKRNDTRWGKALPVLAAFFVMGFCDLVGITSDYMQSSFGWSSAQTGFVPSMVFVWFLFLGIPTGNRMNRLGRKNTVLLSMLVTAGGMFLPLIHYSSATCMAAYMLLGIGNAILQVSLNPLLGNVVTDPQLLTSSLTAGQVIKAVSSLAGPEVVLLATRLFTPDKWYYCFPLLGTATLFFALWLVLTPIPRETSVREKVSLPGTFRLLGDRTLLILFLGIFFIVGTDVATNYISSKLMAMRYGWLPEEVKFAPQVYFFSRTVGALLGVFLLARVSGVRYFRINIVACLLSLAWLMFVRHPIASMVGIGAIGFFASSLFSVIYSLALQKYPLKMNRISGLMITAIAGGAVITPLMGTAIDAAGLTAGLCVILCCMLYLGYCAFAFKTTKP